MLSHYKTYSEQSLHSLGRKLSWINPNVLTVLGLIPPVLFFILMHSENFVAAALVLLLTAIDLLDGVVARANNRVSAFGAFLDSTIDRLADFLIIAGLYVGGLADLYLAAILLVATFLISYTRSRGELASDGKVKFAVGMVERPERIILIFFITLLNQFYISQFLILVLTGLSVITIGQRIWHAYRTL